MYEVMVYSDLCEVGVTEDGDPAISERYFVGLEAEDGTRWRHAVSYCNADPVYVDEIDTYVFPDNRKEDSEKAEKLANQVREHLQKGGAINFAHWITTDPAYGSFAFQRLDNSGHFKERERREG